MHQNVGIREQSVRIIASASMIAAAAAVDGHATWLGIVGALVLLTANFGLCPLYILLGISTVDDDATP